MKQPLSARQVEEEHLIGVLRQLHEDDREGGYRVLADDLADLGYRVSERRVWRLCRAAGIRSVNSARKRRYRTAGALVHDDLAKRDFTASAPNQLWLTDIAEYRTGEGKLYLCAGKEVFSRRIVGYSINARMKAAPRGHRARLPEPHRLHRLCGIPHKRWYVDLGVMLTGSVSTLARRG